MKLSQLKSNPNNPRTISDHKLDKLIASIKDFDAMLEARPIIVNKDYVVLGGNMRLLALQKLGYDEIPDTWVKVVEFDSEQELEFIIKDNVGFGEWDWDILANEWDNTQLGEWGLDVWQPEEDVDYSILDEEDVDDQLKDMADGVMKAIQIEFEPDHYDEAYELVKFWRNQEAYVGKMILDFLKSEKEKL
jgi:hypothetical protein